MLRDVDGWDGEHYSFGAASAGADSAPAAGPTRVAIDNDADGPSATIPDSHLLFTAQFSRAGGDLVLTGEDGRAFVVQDYFASDARARLLSSEGAALSPEVVAALAGPLAPGQYAQAGAPQPAVKAVGRVVQADGDATIVRNGVAMAAHAGDAILKGDVLQTVTGRFGVTFNDGSTLNLTANSRLVVNEFVYDPNGSANSQLLDLVQGSLTFISGEVAHNGDMKIGTPVATMAIRGTVGGVTTANDGTVNFYVSQSATGAVILDSRGAVIANVVQDGPLIIVRPVGPLQVLAEEVQKTPAQLAIELAALQQIVSLQSVGQQIIQQFFQQDPNANPNPQSTDRPYTQFQIDLHTNGPNGQNGDGNPGDNGTPPPTSATVYIPVTDPGTGITTTHVEEIKFVANLAPLNFGPLQQAADEDTALVFSSANGNAISVYDADTPSLTVTLTAAHGVLSLSGIAGLTFTSGDGTGDVTMTFSGTQAAINAALDGMNFTPDADYNGQALVTIVTGDGIAANVTGTVAITVNPVNDAPVIAQPSSPTLAYTENQQATAIDATLTISDVDSATLSGATVKISTNFHAGQDVLNFTAQNGISGSYNSATGVLTLSGVASVADYQAALQTVTYANSSEAPSADTRTISFQVDDGSTGNHLSNVATANVTVAPVNDAPVIAQTSSPTLAYTENQQATAIDAALTISDVDSATLSGATVTISTNFHAGQDVLNFTAQNGISGSFNPATGVLTLSGTASVADYQAALQSVAYANTSDAPSTDTRTISFQVDDGGGTNHASNIATASVTVASVNTAPEAHSGHVSVSEEGLPGGIADSCGIHDTTDSATATGTICATDADGDQLTFTLGQPSVTLCSGGVPISWEIEDGVLIGKAGSQTILTVTIGEHTGDYTVTLSGPIDHRNDGAEDVKSLSIPVTVSDGTEETCTNLTVKIEDDSPKAPDYQIVSNAAVTQDFNVAFVLDYSGSISNTQLNTMLEAVKTAAQSLFDGTTGSVKITVVGFGADAATIGTYTTYADLATAIDHTNSHTGGTRPVNSNGTNFDRAVQQVIVDFSPVQGAKNDVFFLSDGQSSVSSQAEAWGDFVTGHNVSVTAIGIGSGFSVPGLQTVDVDGGVPIEVDQFSGLVDSLLGLVRPELTGNVVIGGGGFGADGGHIASLTVDGTVYYFDGTTVTYDSDGEMVPLIGTTLDRATDFGGHITFYFKAEGGHAAGEWVYLPPADASVSGLETFHYELTDNDGDTAGGNLTVVVEAGDPMTWTNAVSGDWFSDANWSTGAHPTGDDNAAITVPGTYTVTEHGSAAASSLVIGAGVTLSVSTQPDSPTAQLNVINLTFNDGTIVADAGAIAFYGDVVSNGALISRNNSMMYFTGTLAGALTLDGGNAIFTNAVGAEATVDFTAPSSALLLFDAPDFNGHITGFQPGDEIDLYFGQSDVSQVSYEIGNHSVDFTYTLNGGAPTTIVVGTDASYDPEDFVIRPDGTGYTLVFNETWIGGEGRVDLNDTAGWSLGIAPDAYIAATVDDGRTHDADLGGDNYSLSALLVGSGTQLDVTNGTLGVNYIRNAGGLSIANGEIGIWSSVENLAGASIEARAGGHIGFYGTIEGSGLFNISGGTMEFGGSTGEHITVTMNADTGDTLQFYALPVFASDFRLSGFGNGDTIEVLTGITNGSFYFQDYGSQDLLHYSRGGTDAWIWLTDGDYTRENFSVWNDEGGDTHIDFVPVISWATPEADGSVAFGFRHVAGDSLSVDWGDGSDTETGATSFQHTFAANTGAEDLLYQMTVQVGADQTFNYSVKVADVAPFTYLDGTAGNDILVGSKVDGSVGYGVVVAFDGGAGDDIMFAGSGGEDFFIFKQGGGHDIVVGFNTAEDYIDASAFGVGVGDAITPQQFIASAQDTAQGLLFSIGDDSILLQDVHHISEVNVYTLQA